MKNHTRTRSRHSRALAASLPLSETLDAAEDLCATYDLDYDLDLGGLLAELVDHCAEADIHTVGDLADQAADIVRDLTGINDVAAFAEREVAARINQVRNVIGILIMSAALHRGEDPKPVLSRLPKVAGRSTNKRRALDDDEIMVLRLEALRRALKGGSATRIAAQYILIEAGATTSEIEYVTLGCFDRPDAPSKVRLSGNGNDVAMRTIPLPRWARKVVALVLEHHRRQRGDALETAVAYQPEGSSENPNPAAAVCTNMARVMTDLGLGKGNFRAEPHSILRWRLRHTRDTRCIQDALSLSGRGSTKSLYTFLTMEPPRKAATQRKGRAVSMIGQ